MITRGDILFQCAGNVLLFVGAITAGACGFMEYCVYTAQHQLTAFDSTTPDKSSAIYTALVPGHTSSPPDVLGRIRIPELSLAAPVTDGIGSIELIHGVGHIPGTAVAGGLGTMALAGHRDTFFRSLRRVRLGMNIFVTGSGGAYRYQVDRIEVVDPSRVDVLSIQQEPRLILITCYPFTYIGAAPKRFIVYARLTSVAPVIEQPTKISAAIVAQQHN